MWKEVMPHKKLNRQIRFKKKKNIFDDNRRYDEYIKNKL